MSYPRFLAKHPQDKAKHVLEGKGMGSGCAGVHSSILLQYFRPATAGFAWFLQRTA